MKDMIQNFGVFIIQQIGCLGNLTRPHSISIRCANGVSSNPFEVEIKSNSTLDDLKTKILSKEKLDEKICEVKILPPDNVKPESVPFLQIEPSPSDPSDTGQMTEEQF
jgi:hypothetical protein